LPHSPLTDAEAFVFDVDGTLVLSDDPNAGAGGTQLLPGAADCLRWVRQLGKRLALFTNGSGQQSPPGCALPASTSATSKC
jgi:ribonucleotide monophosphatase NagD (HAD superfamily)